MNRVATGSSYCNGHLIEINNKRQRGKGSGSGSGSNSGSYRDPDDYDIEGYYDDFRDEFDDYDDAWDDFEDNEEEWDDY